MANNFGDFDFGGFNPGNLNQMIARGGSFFVKANRQVLDVVGSYMQTPPMSDEYLAELTHAQNRFETYSHLSSLFYTLDQQIRKPESGSDSLSSDFADFKSNMKTVYERFDDSEKARNNSFFRRAEEMSDEVGRNMLGQTVARGQKQNDLLAEFKTFWSDFFQLPAVMNQVAFDAVVDGFTTRVRTITEA